MFLSRATPKFLGVAGIFAKRAMSTSVKPLKILIADGYATDTNKGFDAVGMPRASTLYQQLLTRNVPRGVAIEFVTVSPTNADWKPLTADYLKQFDGCAFTGSSLSVYQDHPDVTKQLDLYRAASDVGVSLFGSCWGLQVAAVALGGKVELNPRGREVGPGRKIALTEAGRGHPMYSGKKHVFEAYESHSDEVTRPPEGALVLAGNDRSSVQSMVVTRQGVESWFVQYHPEYDLKYYAMLIGSRRQRMIDMGFFNSTSSFDQYVSELLELHHNPDRKDIAWKYGFDLRDMTGKDVKEAEPRNWLRYLLSLRTR